MPTLKIFALNYLVNLLLTNQPQIKMKIGTFNYYYNQVNLTLQQAINQVAHLENVQANLKTKNTRFFEDQSVKIWNYFISSTDSTTKHKNQALAFQFIADNL